MNFDSLVARLRPVVAKPGVVAELTHVTRDSRQVEAGSVFCAITGRHIDGHRFVSSLPSGAVAVVERSMEVPEGVGLLVVPDTHAALAQAAALLYGDPSVEHPVIGVTGTNGKTTVVSILEQMLNGIGFVTGRIGTTGIVFPGETFPGGLTTPESPELQKTFRRMWDSGGQCVAMEVSSIGIEQRRVAEISFHTAVFTNLGHDHLDFHGDMQSYAKAKSKLFTELLRPSGGAPRAIVNGDDPAWTQMDTPDDRWIFGRGEHADLRIGEVTQSAAGMSFALETPVGVARVCSPLVGEFNAYNLTAAIGVGLTLGHDLSALVQAAGIATGPKGRLEKVSGPQEPLVLVDYAHTPDALAAVLETVREIGGGEVWVVFGCGGDRDAEKRAPMGAVASVADHVIITSDNPRSESPETIIEQVRVGCTAADTQTVVDRREAIAKAVRAARPTDVVLIAGKGHETTQEFADRVIPFDDAIVARQALESR